jgi:tetratricopeptide (TPR) repeat protein
MPRRTPTRLRLTLALATALCAAPAAAQAQGLSRGTAPLALSNLSRGTAPLALSNLSSGTAPLALSNLSRGTAPLALSNLSRGPAPLALSNLSSGTALLAPAAAPEIPAALQSVVVALTSVEEVAAAAEQAARRDDARSDAELARRLVAGQVMLAQRDSERAAVVFLDLLENAPGSPAAAQARFYLGEALLLLGMRRWAAECFSGTLGDASADARRLHQKAVARLLALASPGRAPGFARKPGLGAMPELRARMQSLGLTSAAPQTPATPPPGELGPTDVVRLRGWVESVAPEQRTAELRYAHGRHLFLSRDYSAAFAELEALAPGDQPLDLRGGDARFRLRATYIAGAAAAALGQLDLAMVRFDKLVSALVRTPEDREIRDLAWLARARLFADAGDQAEAIRSYRQVGRGSPLFGEAMYETAWALLRAGRPEVALAALEQVLKVSPDSPVAPEALQMRGKLQIQQRAWKAAEAEFTALRRDFEARARALAGTLSVEADAAAYYSAVAGSDGPEFKLDALLPRAALPLARGMRRASQAEDLARETGAVTRMLTETRDLLARMEAATQASERARLFVDLGAQWSALDQAGFELADASEQLLAHAGAKLEPASFAAIERSRRTQREPVDTLRTGSSARERRITGLTALHAELAAEASRLRAQLIALERAQLASGRPRTAAFFSEATELRTALAEAESGAAAMHARVGHARATVRFTDPLLGVRRTALTGYRSFLDNALDGTARAVADPVVTTLQARIRRADARLAAARGKVEAAANKRLAAAIVVLRDERRKLDEYAADLAELRERALGTIGQTTAAAVRDVGAELRYWTTRSEVGLLDVAWAVQHAEQDEAERLERSRDQGYKELDRALDQVLEELP